MVDSTISRLRMRDLARLGRSGQITPRSHDLAASPI
jgi:hypothetical protein